MKLSAEQQAWLSAHIETGEFASVDEAFGWLIDERLAQESDDMAWAKPLVDKARAAVADGDTIMLDEHRARNMARLAALAGK